MIGLLDEVGLEGGARLGGHIDEMVAAALPQVVETQVPSVPVYW